MWFDDLQFMMHGMINYRLSEDINTTLEIINISAT